MSLALIIESLTRLHDGGGQLRTVVGNCRIFERQSNFNPRDTDAWDIFNLSDSTATQIIRGLRRTRRSTQRLRNASVFAPDHNSEMNRLFMAWAQAYTDHGVDGRPTQRARQAFLLQQYQWADEVARETSQATSGVRRMTSQKKFYDKQTDVFETLVRLADATVRYGLTTAHQAQALAFKIQFEQIKSLSNNISGDYGRGLASAAEWRRNLRTSDTAIRAWISWSGNRRRVEQSLQRQRAPR